MSSKIESLEDLRTIVDVLHSHGDAYSEVFARFRENIDLTSVSSGA